MPDARTETTLRMKDLVEIEQGILGLGDHAEVLGPPELRERLSQVHARALAQYR